MIIVFQKVTWSSRVAGKCPKCGKNAVRHITITHTVNPYNRNENGIPKTREEVWEDVSTKGNLIKKEPVYHARCE